MNVYLLRGPFPGKGNRKYVICEVDGKRRKINYSKYVLLKEGVEVKSYQQVHHKDGNKDNDNPKNLKPLREYVHKMEDKSIRSKKK
jgi:hypothetical protein